MELLDRRAYLLHETDGFDFGHGFASFHLLVELSAKGHFEDDVDVLFVVKQTVHFDDVGVVEEDLDFDFSDELLNNVLLN